MLKFHDQSGEFIVEAPSRTKVIGLVQYERLPRLCFICGSWDHSLLSCPSLPPSTSREEKDKQEYGL